MNETKAQGIGTPGSAGSVAGGARHEDGSIKELIISMAIALAMALVAKVFVIEAFVIPTGSMAPTLLGQHMQFRSDQTGRSWTVNPWFYDGGLPANPQGSTTSWVTVTDPMTISRVDANDYGHNRITRTGYTPEPKVKALHAGDRILVEKLLYEVIPPKRYEVVVFKNPQDPTINFIKRLIGLPNEQVWIADGDIFVRPIEKGSQQSPNPTGDWQVQRKSSRTQRSLWRPIFSSEFTPVDPVSPTTGARWFETPWTGEGWSTGDSRAYRCDTSEPTVLAWDSDRWPICDWEPYNDVRLFGAPRTVFPVSDVRMRAVVVPDSDGLRITATVRAREHEFRCEIAAGRAVVRMRREGTNWETLGEGDAPVVRAGHATEVEFWHVDQALEVWVDGELVARGTYDWSPTNRLMFATGVSHEKDAITNTSLANPSTYVNGEAHVEWEFEGSAVTLYRVGLDRDLFYQPAVYNEPGDMRGKPAYGTHPMNLVATGPDEYFFLGDNSPASLDSRLWQEVDPEVARQIDPDRGLVNKKMILGKAFFVYFPSPKIVRLGPVPVPVPDFGRMRWIK